MDRIITIGREFGSGGREFGRLLAKELGVEFYDKEIIKKIAETTSLSESYVGKIVEGKPQHLYPITVGHSIFYTDTYYFTQEQSVLSAQNKIITDLAENGPCVIVGRCAEYILKDYNPYKIFIHADIESRIKRCLERDSSEVPPTEKQMKKQILKIDKNRAKYYNFYTGKKWGDVKNYDLCINTTSVNIEEVVKIISKMFK